jgi:hypothetical protein
MMKICSCGKEYLYPRDFWQHEKCAPKITPRDTPKASGKICAEKVVRTVPEPTEFICPVCEARKLKDRERVQRWRAKK